MARIEPFRGFRPRRDIAEKVASPPYDVLNTNEAKNLAQGNEYSFLHIIKPEIDLPENTDLYSDQVYYKAKENFIHFIEKKILIQDTQKNFYLYKQVWGDHTQIGLVAAASVEDYQNNIIKKHELTREDKERDRKNHIQSLNAQTGPVFLTFKQNQKIDLLFEKAMIKKPDYHFTSQDQVEHIFYVIDDQSLIQSIQYNFGLLPNLYVADGHHRSAAAALIKNEKEKHNRNHTGNEEYNFFLTVLFPHNQMKILAYNRVIKDLPGLCKAEFFLHASKHFNHKEAEYKVPKRKHEFCLFIDGKWYLLEAKGNSFDPDDPVESLDVSILQKNLLNPVLGIANPRTDKRIDFVGGIRGTEELERLVTEEGYKMAFSLYPTSIEQLFKVADSGKTMPPKSTWFEPKLKSGLVVHSLDD
jgi:uncharacterized protein (DUF1015 family)